MKFENRRFAALFLFLGLLLIACASTNGSHMQPPAAETYKSVAEKELGKAVKYSFNQDSSYVLCVSGDKPTALNPQPRTRFMVYNLITNKVVYEDNLSDGHVEWKNAHQLAVSYTPEIIRGDEGSSTTGYIYDLQTGKKVVKNTPGKVK